jgi:hypothetical protein
MADTGIFRWVKAPIPVPQKAPLPILEGRRISAGVVTSHRPTPRSSRLLA